MPGIGALTKQDYDEIETVWEASVRATHTFLSEADILAYKSLFPACLAPVDLYGIRSRDLIDGFIGVSGPKVEMLFIRPELRGRGLGRALMAFAVRELGVNQVDVNEGNESAAQFYFHLGFRVSGRSAADGMGKPHPLLHLRLPGCPLPGTPHGV